MRRLGAQIETHISNYPNCIGKCEVAIIIYYLIYFFFHCLKVSCPTDSTLQLISCRTAPSTIFTSFSRTTAAVPRVDIIASSRCSDGLSARPQSSVAASCWTATSLSNRSPHITRCVSTRPPRRLPHRLQRGTRLTTVSPKWNGLSHIAAASVT